MSLAEGFDYLENFDSSILQEIRYATAHNFIGAPIEGYEAERCIVSVPIGEAMIKAQALAKRQGFTLKVYDAYRPLRSALSFFKWGANIADQVMKGEFYPHISKEDIFKGGYIAQRSAHSRGKAIDLTLVPLLVPAQDKYQSGDTLIDSTLPKGQRFDDNSIEMGTGFDSFSDLSHTMNPNISDEAKKNRKILCDIMAECGFSNYSKEWWHFDLKDEPFPNVYFDFPVR